MSKRVKFLIVIIIIGAAGYIVTSSISTAVVSCEVCMDFKGRRVCRTARGPTEEEAIVTARDNACAQIVSGRTDNILCGGSEPASIRCGD